MFLPCVSGAPGGSFDENNTVCELGCLESDDWREQRGEHGGGGQGESAPCRGGWGVGVAAPVWNRELRGVGDPSGFTAEPSAGRPRGSWFCSGGNGQEADGGSTGRGRGRGVAPALGSLSLEAARWMRPAGRRLALRLGRTPDATRCPHVKGLRCCSSALSIRVNPAGRQGPRLTPQTWFLSGPGHPVLGARSKEEPGSGPDAEEVPSGAALIAVGGTPVGSYLERPAACSRQISRFPSGDAAAVEGLGGRPLCRRWSQLKPFPSLAPRPIPGPLAPAPIERQGNS